MPGSTFFPFAAASLDGPQGTRMSRSFLVLTKIANRRSVTPSVRLHARKLSDRTYLLQP